MNTTNALIVWWLIICSSCSSSAEILMRDGSVAEGEILRSTQNEIIVKTENKAAEIIKRSDVLEIDHPGDIELGFGILLALNGAVWGGFGISALINAANHRAEAEEESAKTGVPIGPDTIYPRLGGLTLVSLGGILLATGLPSIIGGAHVWTTSKENAEVPGIDKVEISVGTGMGLSIKASF